MNNKLKIELPKVKCSHCGHIWKPRVDNPKWCPKCLHPDIELVREGGQEE